MRTYLLRTYDSTFSLFNMHLINIISPLLLLRHALAGLIEREGLDRRDDVGACKAILVALQASAFCSSFVPIVDVTSTVTASGATITATTTLSPSLCTVTASGTTITQTSTGSTAFQTVTTTSTTSVSTTVYTMARKKRAVNTSTSPTNSIISTATANNAKSTASSNTKATNSVTSSSPTSSALTAKCSIKGIPSQAQIFVCDVIKQACLQFVKPNTKSVSTNPTHHANRWIH